MSKKGPLDMGVQHHLNLPKCGHVGLHCHIICLFGPYAPYHVSMTSYGGFVAAVKSHVSENGKKWPKIGIFCKIFHDKMYRNAFVTS